jgi:hypothetical protein
MIAGGRNIMATTKDNLKITPAKLKEIIKSCNPEKVVNNFKSAGECGNEPVFRFCQHMKAYFSTPEEAMPYIRMWYKKWESKLIDNTKHQLSFEDIEVQALDVWKYIKHPVGWLLAETIQNLKCYFDFSVSELDGYGGEQEGFLAAVCYELQRLNGTEPFYISERDAAEAMSLDREKGKDRADRTLKVFIRKGILTLAKKGNKYNSTRYFYVGTPPKFQKF